MQDNIERNYWMQLFGNLLNACPIDTHNMQTHIVYMENADEFVIEVNAPIKEREKLIENIEKSGTIRVNKKPVKKNNNTKNAPQVSEPRNVDNLTDYAYDVNYANKSPHKGWIQNQIKQTARIFNAKITYLGGE